ncbi:2-oxo-4-hydroxy-4-carboxy-5-ureidoimidazoline decarboxylase [Neptunomonas concharum]|uniref:2-oxo-4-hydroxy-4-carboxy-5-ureidoimidazoline decarboxylase n=1 Tax=Neptunomonas concharum TaxID=1031538 RepID=A0A5P1RC02_9GAMM|nr:2-oxo-4-hydroxy-4-carboxy-5-ureidoimidazoline decarboxylase [Neptunomonas concharum]QEQ97127.1 2-oxo-4-hydroxy-4-carboxy-5-ureidoimidazoline decarboxylase [Neptunomonas concharum]
MKFRTIKPCQMNKATFVQCFSDIYEHSPWIADATYDKGPVDQFDDLHIVHRTMSEVLLNASYEQQLALINAHPDLAGKAAIQGTLTASSTQEQAGAGIHKCSAEEFKRFSQLNAAYKAKFAFPFIKAVKGSNRFQILEAFASRLKNDKPTEFKQALDEINKIALFRLEML